MMTKKLHELQTLSEDKLTNLATGLKLVHSQIRNHKELSLTQTDELIVMLQNLHQNAIDASEWGHKICADVSNNTEKFSQQMSQMQARFEQQLTHVSSSVGAIRAEARVSAEKAIHASQGFHDTVMPSISQIESRQNGMAAPIKGCRS